MAVDYNDKRFTEVKNEEKAALNDIEQLYGKENADGTYTGGMIGNAEKFYQDKIDTSEAWKDKQTELQQANTDFAIEKIEQQKAQAEKDYTKEQTAAYNDYQEFIDPYGVNAEQMASQGLTNSGYSESSKVRAFTTYQNRVATARESYNQAVINYNNSIKEAKLQNNSILAEIAHNAFVEQLELSLQGFQYKNQLVLDKAQAKQNIKNTYNTRWQDVYDRIKDETENQGVDVFGGNQGDYLFGENTANAVNTAFYSGSLNPDAEEFGTFKNGYQPKGISGHGKLTKTGRTEDVHTSIQYGNNKGDKVIKQQNIWKAEDGTEWIWDGINNKYVPA